MDCGSLDFLRSREGGASGRICMGLGMPRTRLFYHFGQLGSVRAHFPLFDGPIAGPIYLAWPYLSGV